MSVSLQVTVHLHNAGATLLTGVGFLDSSYWRSWFGRAGRELPWEPQGCLWSQTQTHTHANTLTQLLTGTFWQSLCSSHQHSVCLHRSLSAELVCVSPLVFTSSAPEGHASWNGFPHIGHYHFMKECRCYLDVFAQPFIKAEGGKGGHMYFMICCSQHKRHTGELFSTSCTGDGHMEVQVRSQLLALACSALERRLMIIFFSNYFHYWLIVCCLIVQSFSAENCEERSSHSPRVWTDSCFYVQPTV